MPILDMPLDELKTYQGTNPKPDDFDQYWDKSIKELENLDLGYHVEKADFKAKGLDCYHMYYKGIGMAKIHCKLIMPSKIEGKIPALALYHGYKSNCGDWFSKLPYAYNGMVVAAMDVRGQAGLSTDPLQVFGNTSQGHVLKGIEDEDPYKLFYRSVFLDAAQLIKILASMPFVNENRIGASGFSQGGGLTLAAASLIPNLKYAGVGCPFLCDYKRVWEMDLASCPGAYQEIAFHFMRRDPLHERADTFWKKLGYIDLQYLAPRIKARTVFFTGLMDRICPPSTQFAVYNKIKAPKEMKIFPDFDHQKFPTCDDMTLELMRKL